VADRADLHRVGEHNLGAWTSRILAIASALPVDSSTTRSSGAKLPANSCSAAGEVSMRPAERALPPSEIATSQKSR
jgi:hypothetical protein